MTGTAVAATDLRFAYGESEALCGVTFTIEKGEWIAIVGRNGSGKSTLAKLLNGLLLPTDGKLTVLGLDATDPGVVMSLRERVGMVFQNPDNQIVASVIEEDIAFGPENLGVPSPEIRRRVDTALMEVGMEHMKKRPPHTLSGGQKQRIAIAGVLAMRPEIIIFDESTAMLDPKGRRDVMTIMDELNKKHGITVIHITHAMEEALAAGRVLVLDNGQVKLFEPSAELFTEKAPLLYDLGLALPFAMDMTRRLQQGGMAIVNSATVEGLVDALCR